MRLFDRASSSPVCLHDGARPIRFAYGTPHLKSDITGLRSNTGIRQSRPGPHGHGETINTSNLAHTHQSVRTICQLRKDTNTRPVAVATRVTEW